MKQAILVVSFGTTHLDTLEKTIHALEQDFSDTFAPDPCFRAFTSGIVRKRLKANYGMEIPSVEEALKTLEAKGFTHVVLQPSLLLPGEEYNKLCSQAKEASGAMQVTVGCPFLWEASDISAMAQIMQETYPMPDDTILLAMGHGTSHAADEIYSKLREAMTALGMELCTVEGSIDFQGAIANLLQQPKRKVHLVPLLFVAGDHSKNDMAGEDSDSLKSMLEQAGFMVTYSLKGLGEIKAVRNTFVNRVKKLM